MNNRFDSFATAFVVAAVSFPTLASAFLSASRSSSDACCAPPAVAGVKAAILNVTIPTMDCEACAVNIERTLVKQQGVERARVIFKTKDAVVEYDSAKISPEKIVG